MSERMQPTTDTLPLLFQGEREWEGKSVVNLSGYAEWEVENKGIRQWLAPIPADSFTLFPDISPTEPGIVPTGVLAEIDIVKHPNWRQYIRGADIGCGMLMAELPVNGADFSANQSALDEVFERLRRANLHVCFRGNHFINFATHVETGQMVALIHTGSYGDRQKVLAKLVDNPEEYDREYSRTIESGEQTRRAILAQVATVYGRDAGAFDTVHNTIAIDESAGIARIYKGVVEVQQTGELQVLPSSLSGKMVRYKAGRTAQTVRGTSHGTGRERPRAAINDLKEDLADLYEESVQDGRIGGDKLGIMVPSGFRWPMTEIEEAYHPIERSVKHMVKQGLMDVETLEYFKPVAGIKGE